MYSENTTGSFEVHIAGPKTDVAVARRVFGVLREVGILEHEFFLGVYNIPLDGKVATPTGHDLDEPGFMSTIQTVDFAQAKHYALAGMRVLASHGLKGNFEIERVIAEHVPDYQIDVAVEVPDHQAVDDSPLYENHIIWDEKTRLPSNEEICDVIQERFGIGPHQIVDFSQAEDSLVSRVATIYQPTREDVLRFGKQLSPDEKLMGHKYMVTEQVCLVGEPKAR